MKKAVKKNNIVQMPVKEVNGFKVERGIPMPPKEEFRRTKWDFSTMVKNDSFFVPVGEDRKQAVQKSNSFVASFKIAQKNGKHLGIYIDVRVLVEQGQWGYRVWRVA